MASAELVGVPELLAALKQAESYLGDIKPFHKLAAATLLDITVPYVPIGPGPKGGRLLRSGRTSGQKGAGVARYGNARIPEAGPAHFGHGSKSNPRPQGGYIKASNYLYGPAGQPATTEKLAGVYEDAAHEALRVSGLI